MKYSLATSALANIEAEKSILGAILLDNLAYHQAAPSLQIQDFALDAHRRIYSGITHLAKSSQSIDLVTLTEVLRSNKDLEAVGGVGYVSSLLDGVPDRPSIEFYIRIVTDKSRRRRIAATAESLLQQVQDSTHKTDECLHWAQECLLQIEGTAGTATARHVKEIMPEVIRELERQAGQQGRVGLTTGIPLLDLMTGGIRPGELWTVGALPKRGKTALGVQFMLANGNQGTPAVAFSLEMSQTQIGYRFLAACSAIPATQIRNPQYIRKERWIELVEAAARLAESPIYVDDRGGLKIEELLASARLYIRRFGVKLIVVDYIRLVKAPGRETREQVGYVADALRQLVKAENVAVVLLSQLRRPGALNDRPTMLDLKESGDIEAHSHVVLLSYLPVEEDGAPIRDQQELIVGANRNGGIGSVPVFFDEKRLQFFERADVKG